MDSDGGAGKAGGLGRTRGWIRWECSHSNMMWHAGFVRLPGGRRLAVYEDDASRRIVAFDTRSDYPHLLSKFYDLPPLKDL